MYARDQTKSQLMRDRLRTALDLLVHLVVAVVFILSLALRSSG